MAEPAALNSGMQFVSRDRLTPYAFRFLNDLWDRTGGFDNDVNQANSIGLTDSRSAAEIGQLRKEVKELTKALLLMEDTAALRGEVAELKKQINGLALLGI